MYMPSQTSQKINKLTDKLIWDEYGQVTKLCISLPCQTSQRMNKLTDKLISG